MSRVKTITVKVIPKAKQNLVLEKNGIVNIYVTDASEKDKANASAAKALAEYHGISKSCVVLISGKKSRLKKFQIHFLR